MSMENLGPYSNFHELNQDWFLNEFRKATEEWKALGKNFDNLQDAFNDLKSYVQNYFNNLDVTEAINNKLDELVKDGRLDVMLNMFIPYVTPEMFGAKGDGETDDSEAFSKAVKTGKPILCNSNKTYAIANTITFDNPCKIKNGHFIVIKALDTAIIYSKRETLIENCRFDGNGICNNGVIGSDVEPNDTENIAIIRNCTVENFKNNGFSTGKVRTGYFSCFAKNNDVGFDFTTTDTYSDNITPIDNNYGVKVTDSTTINSMHPWQWNVKQTAIYIPENCNNVVINSLFNDTNDICLSIPNECRVNIGNVILLNNDNAPKAIDDNSRFISKRKTDYSNSSYISIDSISGSYDNETYLIIPSNYSIRTCLRIRDVNVYNNPLSFRGIKQSSLKTSQFATISDLITITNNIGGTLTNNIYNVKFTPDSMEMDFRLDISNTKVTLPAGKILEMKFNIAGDVFKPSMTITANYSTVGWCFSYDEVAKTIGLAVVNPKEITGTLYITCHLKILLFN